MSQIVWHRFDGMGNSNECKILKMLNEAKFDYV